MNLVTGGAGHLGNVLVRELVARGEAVRVLILPSEDTQSLSGLPVEIVEGNVLDPDSLIQAMDGVDVVFHMAGLVSITPEGAGLMQNVNVQGTQNVIDAIRSTGVKQLIYTSSIHALERPPLGVSIDEMCLFDPENPAGAYDCTKAQASLLVEQAAQAGMDARIVCPTGVVGPHDYRRSEMGELIHSWVKNPINLGAKGAFDFVDVRDVAVGHILVRDQGKPGETYILGGEHIELRALHKLIKKVTGKDKRFISFPLPIVKIVAPLAELYYKITKTKPLFTRYAIETIISNSDISYEKAKKELGYKPRKLLNTIADTVDWWRENFRKTKKSLRI
jgi:dihydroflavonol-4-reductase